MEELIESSEPAINDADNLQTNTLVPESKPKFSKRNLTIVLLIIAIIGSAGFFAIQYFQTKKIDPANSIKQDFPIQSPSSEVNTNKNSKLAARCKDIEAKIVEGKTYCKKSNNDIVHKESLIVVYPDGSQQELLSTANPLKGTNEPESSACLLGSEMIGEVTFTPNCDYVRFSTFAWESEEQYIINAKTKKIIFTTNEDMGEIVDMIWSPDNSKYVLIEYTDLRAGKGSRALYVSQPNNLDEYKRIWYLQNDPGGTFDIYGKITDVHFIDNNTLSFKAVIDGEWLEKDQLLNQEYHYNFVTDDVETVTN